MTKNKKIIGIVAACVLVAGCIIFAVTLSGNDLKLKEKSVTVEYGQQVSTDAKDYLDLSKVEDKDAYLKEVKVSKDTKLAEGKDYEALGEYEVTISDKKDELKVTVIVTDTTAPKFNDMNEIETFEGDKLDFAEYITASDIDKVELTFDDSEVKYKKAGKYTVIAKAVDGSGNETTKEIKLVVKEKPEASEGEKITTYTDENGKAVSKVVPKNTYPSATASPNKGGSSSGSGGYSSVDLEMTYGGQINYNRHYDESDWIPIPEDWNF